MRKSFRPKMSIVWLQLHHSSMVVLENVVELWSNWSGLRQSQSRKEKLMSYLQSICSPETRRTTNLSKSSIVQSATISSTNLTLVAKSVGHISLRALQVEWVFLKKSTTCAKSASTKRYTRNFSTWSWSIVLCVMRRFSSKRTGACRRGISRKIRIGCD